jgi:hypothetical protein
LPTGALLAPIVDHVGTRPARSMQPWHAGC